jgi:excisionase family DNA binding protein
MSEIKLTQKKENQIIEQPLAYRVKDFCAKIGISHSSFYLLVKQGEIRAVKVGGCRLVPASEVQRLLRNSEVCK